MGSRLVWDTNLGVVVIVENVMVMVVVVDVVVVAAVRLAVMIETADIVIA